LPGVAVVAPRTNVLLLVLAAANFVVGMGAFVVVGVLSPIAGAFSISQAEAGWVMTSYALVYAVVSPVLIAATGTQDRRTLLLLGLGVFAAGAVAAALAPNYSALLAARALMAVGGGLVTPVAASIGVVSSDPAHRGKALATVFGGLTLAQVAGVPAGTWLGYTFGWQAAFVVVALLSLAAVLPILRLVPARLPVPPTSLATLGAVLASPRLSLAVAFTALFVGGLYVIYTYLGPFLEARLHLGRDGVTAMLVLFGVGAVAGNALGGFLTDRIGPARTLLILCLSQVLIMPVLTGSVAGLAVTAALIFVWSVCAWSFMVPQQARLAALDPAKTPVLLALNAAAIYVGGSLGSLAGGLTIAQAGLPALGLGGAVLVAAAAASLALAGRMRG